MIELGDIVTIGHDPFDGVFYKVVAVENSDTGLSAYRLEAYSDKACTRRRPLADGRVTPPLPVTLP